MVATVAGQEAGKRAARHPAAMQPLVRQDRAAKKGAFVGVTRGQVLHERDHEETRIDIDREFFICLLNGCRKKTRQKRYGGRDPSIGRARRKNYYKPYFEGPQIPIVAGRSDGYERQ